MKPAITCLIVLFFTGPALAQTRDTPSLSFGSTTVSLGMTKAQIEQSLATNNEHLEWIPDNNSASVVQKDGTDVGQITFAGDRLAYAAFDYPSASNAVMLAQEVAGAVESMGTKTCQLSNFSSHGTGGSHSDTIFHCGSKRFIIMAVETIGDSNRYTSVKVEIGEVPLSQ
jgi:hypothetical protein